MISKFRCSPSSLSSSTQTRNASSGSSKIWLTRQRSDPFVKNRQQASATPELGGTGFVARSGFKLLELQKLSSDSLIRPGLRIIECGAAPGGWTAAILGLLGLKRCLVIAVDLLPLDKTIEGSNLKFIQGNFMDPIVQTKILNELEDFGGSGKVDLVLSDMLQSLSGNSIRDDEGSHDLCMSTLKFALAHLATPSITIPSKWEQKNGRRIKVEKKGPVLVMKSLRGSLSKELEKELRNNFETVRWVKPVSSRPESREGYWVCSVRRERFVEDKKEEKIDEEDDLYF